jgi:hypothetical protein
VRVNISVVPSVHTILIFNSHISAFVYGYLNKYFGHYKETVSVDGNYRMIPSVLEPRKCEYLKDYSLFNLIFCKYILYL